jgi:hypothetical protein
MSPHYKWNCLHEFHLSYFSLNSKYSLISLWDIHCHVQYSTYLILVVIKFCLIFTIYNENGNMYLLYVLHLWINDFKSPSYTCFIIFWGTYLAQGVHHIDFNEELESRLVFKQIFDPTSFFSLRIHKFSNDLFFEMHLWAH